ncbi:hypothetical protein [Hymenobacter qilianensis]|nr:hypothetical protein [Hymenobacter qilianensis]
MMDQTHIGYTYWQQPPVDKMPEVVTLTPDKIVAAAEPTVPAPHVSDKFISIEAEQFTRAVNAGSITWQHLPDLGRTAGAVTTFPVTAAPTAAPGGASPHLEYELTLTQAGPVTVQAYLSPTLDFMASQGLRYAVSFDDEAPQIINLHTGMVADNGNRPWEQAVAQNIILKTSTHTLAKPGKHVLKLWRVDPGVVVQKLVVDLGGVKPSYLGPPENFSKSTPAPKATKASKGSVGQR